MQKNTKEIKKNQDHVMKTLLMVAIPIALQNLINVGVSTADTLMIGNISEVQLSGISQANLVYFIFTTVLFGLASGSVVLNAQYFGKKEMEPIKTILGFMIRVGIIMGALMGLVVLAFPNQAMSIFTNEPEVIMYGSKYLRIIGFSYLFSGFTGVYLMGLRSIKNVKISMYIYGISLITNVILNYIFIYGKLGFPRMEIEGAAIATLICRILESVLVVIYMYKGEKVLKMRLSYIFKKSRQYFRSLVRYSAPVLMSEVNWGLGIAVQSTIIGRMGVSFLTASSLINVVQLLAGIIMIGIGVGSSIIIGNLIGEGREEDAKKLANKLIRVSVVLGGIVAFAVILLRPIAPTFIEASKETAELIRQMLFVSAYLLFFQALSVLTMAGILRGAGDTLYCATFDVLTLWIIKLGGGLLATLVLHLPPVWVYFILSSDECVKALFTVPRVLKGRWIHDTTLH